jgi:hypothetical protein
MNRVCTGNMALFEVDMCMSFHLEILLQFVGIFGHNSAIQTIRGGRKRTFWVVILCSPDEPANADPVRGATSKIRPCIKTDMKFHWHAAGSALPPPLKPLKQPATEEYIQLTSAGLLLQL